MCDAVDLEYFLLTSGQKGEMEGEIGEIRWQDRQEGWELFLNLALGITSCTLQYILRILLYMSWSKTP